MDRIERIKQMEEKMDRVASALDEIHEAEARLFDLLPEIGVLDEYSRTLWLSDFEADGRGELPRDLKRGVLSEDMLYNILEEARYRTEGSEWAD